jgi:hypothetical protein
MRYAVWAFTVLLVGFSSASTGAADDFAVRCQTTGVIKCVGFDSSADITGGWGSPHGITSGAATPALDTSVKASGNSSLKFTIPSNSPADSSGTYFTNFSDDLSIQFGENQEFFVQWRQRFSPEFLNTIFTGGGGWKQSIVTTGDKPPCSTSNGTGCYASCEAIGIVTQNTYQRNFPVMYDSCSGSTTHGPYDEFNESFTNPLMGRCSSSGNPSCWDNSWCPSGSVCGGLGQADFKVQNGRPAPYCTYLEGYSNPKSYFPPVGNCLGYYANEWMTFQIRVKTGPRRTTANFDEFTNSYVQLWVAREGQPSELAVNWGPYNLSAGSPAEDQKFGKLWFLPYNTHKDPTQVHPTAYTWYDELIISRTRIPDPASSGSTQPPVPPTNVHVK